MDTAAGWLPRELLVRILYFVDVDEDRRSVTRVCQTWRNALLESGHRVTFRAGQNSPGPELEIDRIHDLSALFPLCRHLRVVASPSRPFDPVLFSLLRPLELPCQLSSIELHKVQVDATGLSSILHAGHDQLRDLKCTQVEFVDVGRWKPGRKSGVWTLHLSDCRFVTARGVARSTEKIKALGAFLKAFAPRELTLETMELSDNLLGGYLAEQCDLTSLNLAGSRGFSHRSIARLPKFKLKELVLSACWVLNDDMCRVICDLCPCLETLGVYEGKISTTTVQLISNLSHLKTLDMGYSDGDVSPIDLRRMLRKLTGNLSVLNLSGVSAVNDYVLEEIGQMKTLKRLDISGCPGLTSSGLAAIAGLDLLEDLACGWSSKLCDAALALLPRSLERLDVSYASSITDVGINHLKQLGRLKELELTGCKVSREGIEGVEKRGVVIVA